MSASSVADAATIARPPRTLFITLLGVATILVGGLASLFSAFALLMTLGKPYATQHSDFWGIFLIFILPPGTLLAGIGLLPRWRWARWWMILLMAALVAIGVKGLVAPSHQNPAYAPLPGSAADALNQSVLVQSAVCITVGGLLLIGLFSGPVLREFSSNKSNSSTLPNIEPWRVGHHGRDLMFYEERHGGDWRRLDIDGEMLMGHAHHVIYFASPETWQGYPDWARQRRDEIIARVKSRFTEQDYEYQENGSIPRPVVSPVAVPVIPGKPDGTILPAFIFLVCVAAASFWFAAQGLQTGETRLPARLSGNHRVFRAEKPALFWTSIGLLGTVGIASTGAGLWLVLHRIRSTRGRYGDLRRTTNPSGDKP